MKGLVFSSLAGLLIASIGCGYADAIRITAINESPDPAKVIVTPNNQTVGLNAGSVKMFTAQYKYPATISMQSLGQYPKTCSWAMPPIGKQTIRMITLNIGHDQSTHAQTCLLSWQ